MILLLALSLLVQQKSAEELIQELKSEKVEARRALEKLGNDALPDLEKAVKGPDFDIRRDLREIIEVIQSAPGLEILRRIEDRISEAKTISIKCKWQQGAEETHAMSAQIHLKKKDKIRVETSWTSKSGSRDILLVSNGSFVCYRPPGDPGDDNRQEFRFIPADGLNRKFVEEFTALDVLAAVTLWGQPGNAKQAEWHSGTARSRITKAIVGPEENGLGTVSYEYAVFSNPFKIKVWYDQKTFRLSKRSREMDQPLGEGRTTVTESFDEWSVDSDIPDDKVQIPPEKK